MLRGSQSVRWQHLKSDAVPLPFHAVDVRRRVASLIVDGFAQAIRFHHLRHQGHRCSHHHHRRQSYHSHYNLRRLRLRPHQHRFLRQQLLHGTLRFAVAACVRFLVGPIRGFAPAQ